MIEPQLSEPAHFVAAPLGILHESLRRVLACCYKRSLSIRSGSMRLDDETLTPTRIAVCRDWDEQTFLTYLEGGVVVGSGP
jgi:hypothetical protein